VRAGQLLRVGVGSPGIVMLFEDADVVLATDTAAERTVCLEPLVLAFQTCGALLLLLDPPEAVIGSGHESLLSSHLRPRAGHRACRNRALPPGSSGRGWRDR